MTAPATEDCYVKVLASELKTHQRGVHKQISVVQETGFWHQQFCFNIFSDHPLFQSIDRYTKLFVKVINKFTVHFNATFDLVSI